MSSNGKYFGGQTSFFYFTGSSPRGDSKKETHLAIWDITQENIVEHLLPNPAGNYNAKMEITGINDNAEMVVGYFNSPKSFHGVVWYSELNGESRNYKALKLDSGSETSKPIAVRDDDYGGKSVGGWKKSPLEGKKISEQYAVVWSFSKDNTLISTSKLKTKSADKLTKSQVQFLYFDKIITEDMSQSQKDLINSDPFRKIAVGSAKKDRSMKALFWLFDNENNSWLPAEALGTLRENQSGASAVSTLTKVGDTVILAGQSDNDNTQKMTGTLWVVTPKRSKRDINNQQSAPQPAPTVSSGSKPEEQALSAALKAATSAAPQHQSTTS